MSLAKIFGLYTICFLGVTILIGIAEQLFGLSPQWIGWIFMGLSLGHLRRHRHHHTHFQP